MIKLASDDTAQALECSAVLWVILQSTDALWTPDSELQLYSIPKVIIQKYYKQVAGESGCVHVNYFGIFAHLCTCVSPGATAFG